MLKAIFRMTVISLGIVISWQSVVFLFEIPIYILPSPYDVFKAFIFYKWTLLNETIPTLMETISGFFIGILAGFVAALFLHYFRLLTIWLLPLILISQAMPTFAIAPLFVIWLGYGLQTKIITAALMIFFPVTSAFYDGLQKTPREWLLLAQSMDASPWKTLYHIGIPAALPHLSSGIRIAAVTAPLGAVVGEWVGSSRGLGFLMLNANARMQIDTMFAALLILIILALGMYFFVDTILRRLIWWTST